MGGVNSCWTPRYRNPNRCRENHSSTPRVKSSHRRNLSAAFNLADLDVTTGGGGGAGGANGGGEQLNINTATEEELMTLPDINRATAHNIVDYRRQIGGFKKVEDLALVSGVGATKLNLIRVEICVGRKRSSQSSSRSSSRNDLSTQDTGSISSSRRGRLTTGAGPGGLGFVKVNLNTSNVFQLMKVKEISQTIAENIVVYRDRKGPFRSIDDLVKVKGLRPAIVSAIRPHLYLQEDARAEPDVVPLLNGTVSATSAGTHSLQPQGSGTSSSSSLPNQRLHPVSAMTSLEPPPAPPPSAALSLSQEDLLSAYGPLARKSIRKPKLSPILLRRDNRKLVRVATWNLQSLSLDKAENPGVKEVTCLTILENGLGIVAIQEVTDPEALRKICSELNSPTIPNVKRWPGVRGHWQCSVSKVTGTLPQGGAEYLGFLYDSSQDVHLTSATILETNTGTNRPFIAHFQVCDAELVLVNMHPEAEVATVALSDVATKVEEQNFERQAVVLLGHLSLGCSPGSQLEERGFHGLTAMSLKGSNMAPTSILVNGMARSLHTGHCDEVMDGLTSPWIPDRWKWGGPVSAYRPVWAEFFVRPADKFSPSQAMTTPSSALKRTPSVEVTGSTMRTAPAPVSDLSMRLSSLKLAARPLSGAGDGC